MQRKVNEMTKPLSPAEKAARKAARANPVDPFANCVDVSMVSGDNVDVSPVAFVWSYIDANKATKSRKEMIHALRAMDLNRNMVNTQVSRYFTADGDRAAWYRLDRERKAARTA